MKTIYLEQLGGIKRKFLGKIFPMLILEVTKKQGFTLSLSLSLSLSLKIMFLKKPYGDQIDPRPF